MKNILISTLGANPAIIEETIGLFNYSSEEDFYRGKFDVSDMRSKLSRVDELWLISTDQLSSIKGLSAKESFEKIKNDCGKYGAKIRMFVLKEISDITSELSASQFHDLLLRVVSFGHEQTQGGKLYLSLACGRKTMSTDMQDAAYCFGCDMLIHVLGDNQQSAQPLLMGNTLRNEAIKTQRQQFDDEEYVLSEPQTEYLDSISQQKSETQHFYTSFYLGEHETRSNFYILYTLPPSKIQQLKSEKLGVDPKQRAKELKWIKSLPKTDLHCHLGGVLSPKDIMRVAMDSECFNEDLAEKNEPYKKWLKNLHREHVEYKDFRKWCNDLSIKFNVPKCCIAAPYIRSFDYALDDALTPYIYGEYMNESSFCDIGITAYEQLGDIQGSALLDSFQTIDSTLERFLNNCVKENVQYLEIRCSPLNYAKSAKIPAQVLVLHICDVLEKASRKIETSLIFIVSRHRQNMTSEYVQLVEELKNNELFKKYFRGFDVAGDEAVQSPRQLRESFIDILKECYNITIHAGEDQPVENIWEAVYHLSAERIGHGLTLQDNEDLLNKFLERGIGIEMCPSSNFQIVGYGDNYYPNETAHRKQYPLKKYLDKELLVSVNTDDPGISLTNMTNELHKAARMTEGGLSKWEILQLICNGFRTAFYPYERKKELIRKAEDALGKLIRENLL